MLTAQEAASLSASLCKPTKHDIDSVIQYARSHVLRIATLGKTDTLMAVPVTMSPNPDAIFKSVVRCLREAGYYVKEVCCPYIFVSWRDCDRTHSLLGGYD
jgi:hypothetical protein